MPPPPFLEQLEAELEALAGLGRRRSLTVPAEGGELADFCSNDYLGLARHPTVVAAAREAAQRFGAGGRAARLLGGGSELEARLEASAAAWLGAEAALLFPTGFQANLGLLTALAGAEDVVFSDALNHASIIDACRLSRARVEVYPHLDLGALAAGLVRHADARRRIVVTETVFSMDGDLAPLPELAGLCARQDAALLLDEAHAVGLLGPTGAGAWAAVEPELAARPPLLARVLTGGKALGVAGALVVGPRAVVEVLVNRARPFVFTTACPPALVGALLAAIELQPLLASERARCLDLARRLAAALGVSPPAGAIVPWVVGTEGAALERAAACRAAGLDVRAVRPPTVPAGTSRLRLVCHARNTDAELDRLLAALGGGARPAAPPASPPPILCVVGTDTGVGKTVVSAALLAAGRAREPRLRYWKPVQTGEESDTETVAGLSRAELPALLPPLWELPLPASPHEAAAAAGVAIEPGSIVAQLDRHRAGGPVLVELAGGLLVPYTLDFLQLDLLAAVRPRIVLVARSGLGTLNHTLLSVEALRARGLEPRLLVLVGPPHASNRATLVALTNIETVLELPPLEPLDADTLGRWLVAQPWPASLFGGPEGT